MRAINHAMTGALIGLSAANPVALPLAFASHYLLDAIPHYAEHSLSTTTRLFKVMLLVDAALCMALVATLAYVQPAHWWLAAASAFVATSPDFMWVRDFLAENRGKALPVHRNKLVVWHRQVQWFQKPIGIVVETTWAIACLLLLSDSFKR